MNSTATATAAALETLLMYLQPVEDLLVRSTGTGFSGWWLMVSEACSWANFYSRALIHNFYKALMRHSFYKALMTHNFYKALITASTKH
jgi:hypothetical protein